MLCASYAGLCELWEVLMNTLRDQILNCLNNYSYDDDNLVEELEKIIGEHGEYTCSVIFELLTQLKLEPQTANYLWYKVLDNRREMMECLGRNVGLRTSVCDYLCTVHKSFKNPMILEMHVFENYLQTYMYDYLTGLYSRRFLEVILDRELARCKRHETELSLMFFDIDNFKYTNDSYGHATGDECLSKVASIIKNSIRKEDTAVRYGGEEIVLILPLISKLQAINIAERIRKQIFNTIFMAREKKFSISVSIGLVTYPMDGSSYEELIDKADLALLQAKSSGKNKTLMYSREKRRYKRVSLDAEVQVNPVGFQEKTVVYCAHAKNISLGGMLFEIATFFNIGTKLELKLLLSNLGTELEITGVRAEVVRNQTNPIGTYDTGIYFLDVEKKAKVAIHNYLVTRDEPAETRIH